MIEKSSVEVTPELLEQNPLLAMALTGMSMLVIAALVGSLTSWFYLVMKARRGEAWLPVEPRGPRAWGLADLVVVVVLVVMFQSLFATAYIRLAGIDLGNLVDKPLPAAVSAAASFGNVAAVGLTLAWLAFRFQVLPSHAGFRTSGWLKQLQVAGVATLATLPIVYLMMAGVSIGLDTEYEHPLLDEIRATATLGSYLLGVVTAVLLAPLAEEFLFRVMLQGWLQSWPLSSPQEILLGASPFQRRQTQMAGLIPPSIVGEVNSDMPADTVENPYQPPVVTGLVDDRNVEDTVRRVTESELDDNYFVAVPPVWPAVVTGILFGLAHWGYGLSFIPLIVLGVVLGLIYRSTNSIWPCFVVHFALNATSMLGLGLSILMERAELVGFMFYRLLAGP